MSFHGPLGSDVLPFISAYLELLLAQVRCGCVLRKRVCPFASKQESHVRLSMHPGPFTVPMSDNEEIVERSIEEFEYPPMSYAGWDTGVSSKTPKCNVPSAGKVQPVSNTQLTKDFPEARNTITITKRREQMGTPR